MRVISLCEQKINNNVLFYNYLANVMHVIDFIYCINNKLNTEVHDQRRFQYFVV